MRCFSVRGFTAATSGASNEPIAVLWNNYSDQRIWLLEFGFWRQGTVVVRPQIYRTSTRGTPGTTETPDADNAWDGSSDAPNALLDLALFSVFPTVKGPLTGGYIASGTGTEGFGLTLQWEKGIAIEPGNGCGLRHTNANICATSEVYAVWLEEES